MLPGEKAAEKLKERKEPPTCKCGDCKQMCEIPCWPTPEEALKLIEAGHADKLEFDGYNMGIVGVSHERVMVLAPKSKERSRGRNPICIFQTTRGLCSLHNTGMKPTEGRLVACHDDPGDWDDHDVRSLVAETWQDSALAGEAFEKYDEETED